MLAIKNSVEAIVSMLCTVYLVPNSFYTYIQPLTVCTLNWLGTHQLDRGGGYLMETDLLPQTGCNVLAFYSHYS